ncbi:hypothetical protein Plano_0645 [Planococcus sp. PAMC 21323]|uniref:DUF2812 domain-containing protein n=1 Tax=Planococcus sp. PAMC 21323 TaxID=1526927 RepID=UPI00057187F1|nr:DUF2812 domain-containing protein [Planococcus sp. PAMC 21323]AIY04610.1 hypothetical protein Plano_0645 [Planococcus sp. PAMC 21323]
MIKIYRPFWSYDVEKTETWLSQMAKDGHIFEKLDRWTRCFYFNEGDAELRFYQIAYDKFKSPTLSSTLLNDGWEMAALAGKWQVSTNSQSIESIKKFPTRDGVIKHNQRITYLFYGLLFYLLAVLAAPISLAFSYLFMGEAVVVEESPYWILTYLFFAIVIGLVILGIYSIIKITKTNKKMSEPLVVEPIQTNTSVEKQRKRELKHSGRRVTKIRFAWMYSPDKLETWLESMEQRGFNLVRVNPIGMIFHFSKGKPRRIAYKVDYQRQPPASYFNIHQEAGWSNCFNSISNLEKWTIWSQEYTQDQGRPQLYSDNSTRINQAKKMVLTYTTFFLPFTLLYLYFLFNSFNQKTELSQWLSWGTFAFILCITIYGSLLVKLWTYYMRLKKQVSV